MYKTINWKDYPDKTTPVNATNLNKMDNQILANAQAIGETDISEIEDGTLKGAVAAHEEAISALNMNISHVGMIIHSTTLDTEAKVKAIYGGTTWTKIEGRFLLGSSGSYAVNKTGGEATHTLTTAEMPPHTHTFTGTAVNTNTAGKHKHTVAMTGYSVSNISGSYAGLKAYQANGESTSEAGDHAHSVTAKGSNSNTGGGGAHNNMPPYKAVYIWERTA